MIVKVKRKNTKHRDLTFGQPYVVTGIEADEFRILNDAGRSFLYSPTLFSMLDNREPAIGLPKSATMENAIPFLRLIKPGFFEDFFDQKTKAVATFWQIVNRRLAASSEVA